MPGRYRSHLVPVAELRPTAHSSAGTHISQSAAEFACRGIELRIRRSQSILFDIPGRRWWYRRHPSRCAAAGDLGDGSVLEGAMAAGDPDVVVRAASSKEAIAPAGCPYRSSALGRCRGTGVGVSQRCRVIAQDAVHLRCPGRFRRATAADDRPFIVRRGYNGDHGSAGGATKVRADPA